MRHLLLAASLTIGLLAPANAAVVLTYADVGPGGPIGVDARYELAGGYLQSVRGLPLVGVPTANTALPPLERAVGEVRIANDRSRGFHIPTAATGIPGVANTPVSAPGFKPAEGVFSALTNAPSLDRASPAPAGEVTTAWQTGTPVAFSMARVGTTITFTVGTDIWRHTADYMSQINAFQFRLASRAVGGGTSSSTMSASDITFTDIGGVQSLGLLSASNGDRRIALYEGITGDFSIAGNFAMAWEGTKPNGSNIAAQLKLLSIPAIDAVPEPASWAMLIAGFGLVGGAMRRRRPITASA